MGNQALLPWHRKPRCSQPGTSVRHCSLHSPQPPASLSGSYPQNSLPAMQLDIWNTKLPWQKAFSSAHWTLKKKGLKENRHKSLARLLHPVPMMVSCIDLLSRKLPNDHIYISALLRRWFVCGKTLMFFETTVIVVAVSFIWPSGSELPEYGSFPRGTNYLY